MALFRCGGATLEGDATETDVKYGKTFYSNDAQTMLTGKMVCVSLGTATSFNVQSVCSTYGIDYTKLTNNNFFISGMTSASNSWSPSHPYADRSGKDGASLTKSYNSSTGVLSCYFNYYETYSDSNGTHFHEINQSCKVTVYLIYGF